MKRNSLITCSLIVFALFFEWLGVKVNGVASHIEIHKQAKLLEFSIAPLIAVFATVSYSKIRHPKIITAVMTAHIVFEAVALHFGWVISVDSSGRYHRGPLYPIYILVFSISIVYYMICVLKTDTQYYPKPSLVLLAILAFLAIGICFQMVNSDIRTVYICVAMSNYFFYTHDGRDIETLDLRSLRKKIGVVTQNGKLFQGDIYSNIVISAPYLSVDDAWRAAEIADIAEDIRKMPMGMHTIISEGSGGISGGQKQRLMIARAVAPNPKVLMFDEATSALDNITQKKVSEALDRLKCTRIVIAHRLSTIRQCDRIIVLDGGKIIEDGTYDELIAKKGNFYELVERQRLDH